MKIFDILGAHKWWIFALIVAAMVVAGTVSGYRHGLKIKQGEWDKANAATLLQAEAERQALERFAQQITRDYLSKESTIRKQRDELKQRIPEVTDGRVCFADWGAVQLWNAALQGPSTARDTGGAVPDTGTPAVTDEAILENHNENAARWRECREKVKSIEQLYRKYQDGEGVR